MSEKRLELVKKHVAAFSSGNWDQYRETVLPNVVYVERATGRRTQNANELIKTLEEWKVAFPDLQGTVKNLLVQEDMVMAEIHWEGTHRGLLRGPFGELPATGRKGSVEAVELFHFEGERIREARHYFDMMTILNQLGVEAPARA